MSNPIGNLGTIPTVTVGGGSGGSHVYTDVSTNLIILSANDASNGNSTFRKLGANTGAGYQVTAGKTLTITSVLFFQATTATQIALLQSDNDVGFDTATSFTNAIYQMTGSSTSKPSIVAPITVGAIGYPTYWTIAATKYAGMTNAGNGTSLVYLFGYEA